MAKVAKLVLVSLMTRVVVDEDATYEEVIEAARPRFIPKITDELFENIEEVFDDKECPYDAKFDDAYQCGSCEQSFDELEDGSCPHCGSGNWVHGCIDEPEK